MPTGRGHGQTVKSGLELEAIGAPIEVRRHPAARRLTDRVARRAVRSWCFSITTPFLRRTGSRASTSPCSIHQDVRSWRHDWCSWIVPGRWTALEMATSAQAARSSVAIAPMPRPTPRQARSLARAEQPSRSSGSSSSAWAGSTTTSSWFTRTSTCRIGLGSRDTPAGTLPMPWFVTRGAPRSAR